MIPRKILERAMRVRWSIALQTGSAGARVRVRTMEVLKLSATSPKTIGVMVFQQMVAADLIGPIETFSRATIPTDGYRANRCYNVITVGVTTEPSVMECGLVIKPHLNLDEA